MAKTSLLVEREAEVEALKARVEQLDGALSLARKGFFRIINLDPVNYINDSPGRGPAVVKAFGEAQSVAESYVLKLSDATEVIDAQL